MCTCSALYFRLALWGCTRSSLNFRLRLFFLLHTRGFAKMLDVLHIAKTSACRTRGCAAGSSWCKKAHTPRQVPGRSAPRSGCVRLDSARSARPSVQVGLTSTRPGLAQVSLTRRCHSACLSRTSSSKFLAAMDHTFLGTDRS